MTIEFKGKIRYWRGPAPRYYVTVPPKERDELKAIFKFVTYGWGMIPVKARIGKTEWKTAMFPKEGSWIVPLKVGVRKAEQLDEGDTVTIELEVG